MKKDYIPFVEYTGDISMKDFVKVMKALADPCRVKIVKMLQRRTMCVCEMREALSISQPSVSKHLKILENAGLIDHRKDGLWVEYYPADGGRSPYAASLLGNLRHWMEDESEIREILNKIPHIRREDICCK
jgi:ArsR family transcriptional regulator, arsenate/arsenite/antimonite-responsive transcriptional repressor